jgi:hypothetical protein
MDVGAHLADKRHRHRIIADALYIFEVAMEGQASKRLPAFTCTWVEERA